MYVGRPRSQIRDELLAAMQAEYAALAPSKVLNINPGSHAWNLAAAVALPLERLEAQAAQVDRDILPDQASPEALTRHGYVYGIDPEPGVKAALTVTVTGTPSATITIPANTIQTYSDGTRYVCIDGSVTLSGGGSGTIVVQAEDYGVVGTREVGDTLSFVSAPTGLNTTATVDTVVTEGENEESAEEWGARIAAQFAERPGSGNVADWQDWCEGWRGSGDIVTTFVYPLLRAPSPYVVGAAGTPGQPGYLTLLPVGEAQGARVTNTRLLGRTPGTFFLGLLGYLAGALTSDGDLIPEAQRRPFYPATLPVTHISPETPSVFPVDVSIRLTVSSAAAFSFSGYAPVVGGTTTSIVVTGNYSSSGVNLSGKQALVNVGTDNVRGGYTSTTLGTGSYNGGTGETTFPLSVALPAAPVVGSELRGYSSVWPAVRLAVFALFDALSPGDTSPPSRVPPPSTENPTDLYPQALAFAAMNADATNVLSAETIAPAAILVAAQKTITTLGEFLITA